MRENYIEFVREMKKMTYEITIKQLEITIDFLRNARKSIDDIERLKGQITFNYVCCLVNLSKRLDNDVVEINKIIENLKLME